MKKKNFVTLVLGVVFGLLFGVGMCMCLLPEWNSFTEGVIVAAIGGVGLLALGGYRFLSDGKKISVNRKLLGKIAFGIVGVGAWYVYDHGLASDALGNPRRRRRHRLAALPHSHVRRHTEIRKTLAAKGQFPQGLFSPQ